MADFNSKLQGVLRYCGKDSQEVAAKICERFPDFLALSSLDSSVISGLSSEKHASMIMIISAIASRIGTEKFKFGRAHTDEEIESFLSAYFLNKANETLLIMPLDKAGRIICAEKVVEGTVNFSSVLPRKLLEVMLKYNSAKAIIAHNHPAGKAVPSEEDVETTRVVFELFRTTGRELVCHYVVAGCDAAKVNID